MAAQSIPIPEAKNVDITYAGQIYGEDPSIQAYKLGLLEAAKLQAEKDITLPAFKTAGLSDLQKTATGAGQAYADLGTGIGGYAPFIQSGANLLGGAQSAFEEAGRGIAGLQLAPTYQQSQQGLQTAAQTAAGIQPYVNLMGTGYQNINQGTGMLGSAAQYVGGAAQQFDPSTQVSDFTNPYQQEVIDEATRQIDRQGELAKQGLSAQAIRTGAFGGTREGVQRAELDRNLTEMKNRAILGGLQTGYGDAIQRAQAAFESQQARQAQAGQGLAGIGQAYTGQGLAGAQLAGQQAGTLGNLAQLQSGIAQGMGGMGAQQAQTELAKIQAMQNVGQGLGSLSQAQANLGGQAQGLAQGDINAYLALGGLQQQATQQALDASRATELQKTMYPYQQLGFLSDIYKGAPSTQSVLTAGAAPGTSPLAQAIGTGISAIGAIGAANKAGLGA
jgi:hypothetical protein